MHQWNHGKQLLRVWRHQSCTNGCKLQKKNPTTTYFYNFVDGCNGKAHTSCLKPVLKTFVLKKTTLNWCVHVFLTIPQKTAIWFFGFNRLGKVVVMETGGEQARVITPAIILLCHSSYASAGFFSTDAISREINGNLHGHSCTHGAVNKYTCAPSCIRINTATEQQPDANPARMWGGTQTARWKGGSGNNKWGRQWREWGARKRERGRSEALFNLSRSVDRAESSVGWIDG